MIVYILTKCYSDNSAFYVCGATEDRAVAQAFHAGGKDADPRSAVYELNTNDPVRGMFNPDPTENFDDDRVELTADVPSLVTSIISDYDIPL